MSEILFMLMEEVSSNKIIFYSLGVSLIIFFFFLIIGLYKIFEKADEKGWKSLIPIYNIYMIYKIFWKTKYFVLLLIISFVCILSTYFIYSQELFELLVFILTLIFLYHQIILSIRISRSFKKNIFWSLGIIFFPYLFIIILGFNKSKYIKFEE